MKLLLATVLWLAAALNSSARADTVELKSGRKLYGLVVSATSSNVEIDMGEGTTSIPRSIVRKITRSSPQERRRLEASFANEYFESGRGVPKESEPVFQLYQEVAQTRRRAGQAGEAQRRLRASRDEIESGMGGYRGVGRRLAIERTERLQAVLDAGARELDTYAVAYWRLRKVLAALPNAASKAGLEFRARLERKLKPMDAEFEEQVVPLRVEGDRKLVEVLLEGRTRAVFAVDFKTPTTRVGPQTFTKLKPLPYLGGIVTEGLVTLASPRPARQLSSIELGRFRVEHVGVEEVSDPGVDGTLGMSFWGAFYVEDGGDHLKLRRLKTADRSAVPVRGGLPSPADAWAAGENQGQPSWSDVAPHNDTTRYPYHRTMCQDPDAEFHALLDTTSPKESPRVLIRSGRCSDIVAWSKPERQARVRACLDRQDVYGSVYQIAGAFYWDGRCAHHTGYDPFFVDFRNCDKILVNPQCPNAQSPGLGGGWAGGKAVGNTGTGSDSAATCYQCEHGCDSRGECNAPPQPQPRPAAGEDSPSGGQGCHCPWGCDEDGTCRPRPEPPPDARIHPPQQLPGDVQEVEVTVEKKGAPIELKPGCPAGQAPTSGGCAPIELRPKGEQR